MTRRFALWPNDLDAGVCAAPEECAEALGERELPVVLEHAGARAVFDSTLREDVEWQFTDVPWPADIRPGVVVTVSWQPRGDEIVVRTTPLDEPLRVDGVDFFHEYDPKVVTRSFDPGTSNRGKVLHAVRKQGRVLDDGSAMLAESVLPARTGLQRGAKAAFLLRNAVDQLIREGYLTRVDGSVDKTGYPSYPAVEGQKPAEMLFYAPMVEPVPMPGSGDGEEHEVNGFVRKLPPGAHASERQTNLHEEIEAEPLAPGYTYVKRHRRQG